MTPENLGTEASGQSGYTLVELLVVLAILGLLSLLTSAAISLGVVAWGAGGAAGLSIRQMVLAQTELRYYLGHAFPSFDGIGPGARLTFDGGSHSIRFLSQPRDPSQKGRVWVEMSVRDGDFMLRTWPELTGGGAGVDVHSERLLPAVADVAFEFSSSIQPEWLGQWRGQRRLPQLVRVQVKFQREGRFWPTFIAPVRVQADASCSYDGISHACLGG